jgi:hypothetical protein
LLILRAFLEGYRSSEAFRLKVRRGDARGGVLRVILAGELLTGVLRVTRKGDDMTFFMTRKGDDMASFMTRKGDDMTSFLTSSCVGFGLIGLTAVILVPGPIGLTADLGRTGCFRIADLFSLVSIETSLDLSCFVFLGGRMPPSIISHSSLSASAVLFRAFDRTGIQNMELISNS